MSKTKEENFALLVGLIEKAGLNEGTSTIETQLNTDITATLTPLVKQIVAGTGATKGDILYVVSAGGLPTWITI